MFSTAPRESYRTRRTSEATDSCEDRDNRFIVCLDHSEFTKLHDQFEFILHSLAKPEPWKIPRIKTFWWYQELPHIIFAPFMHFNYETARVMGLEYSRRYHDCPREFGVITLITELPSLKVLIRVILRGVFDVWMQQCDMRLPLSNKDFTVLTHKALNDIKFLSNINLALNFLGYPRQNPQDAVNYELKARHVGTVHYSTTKLTTNSWYETRISFKTYDSRACQHTPQYLSRCIFSQLIKPFL